jgi:hypothetical protein
MFKTLTSCIFSLSTFISLPLAAQVYQSAHAIVVSQYDNHEYVLLGKMQGSHKLSTFGVLRDFNEKNPKITCAREVEEESLGVLGNVQSMRKLLQNAIQISGFQNGHICYLLPAKFYGYSIPSKFRQIRFNPYHDLSYSQKEMIDIVAIRIDKLKSKFAKGNPTFPDNEGIQRSLRDSTKGALQAAIDSGHL